MWTVVLTDNDDNVSSRGGGDQEVFAGEGDDTVDGGAGNDRLYGWSGEDRLIGGAGSDQLVGEADNDVLEGGAGHDILYGDSDDLLYGDPGDDRLFGGSEGDSLYGGDGDDELWAEDLYDGTRVICDDPSDAVLRGVKYSHPEELFGGDGDDVYYVGHDFDAYVHDEDGVDTLVLNDGFDMNVYIPGPSAYVTYGNDIDLQAGSARTVFGADLLIIGIENVYGDRYNDVIRGDSGVNILSGGAGDDLLEGRGGADTLDGGGGGRDVAEYRDASGVDVDLVRTTQIGSDAEGDVLIGIEDVNGSLGNDILRGDGGANHLFGNDGADVLEGRGGGDTLDGSDGFDTASYQSSSAPVSVNLVYSLTGVAAGSTGGDAAGDTLISIEGLIGSSHDDHLTGNAADNCIDGGHGNDFLNGLGGTDTVSFVSWDPAGGARVEQTVIISLTDGMAVRRSTLGPTLETDTLWGFENVIGSNLAETITGNDADNVLEGRGGNDTIRGGGGYDTIQGGSGSDTIQGDWGRDTLDGGPGRDVLTGGSDGDTFIWGSTGDTGLTISTADLITDFSFWDGDRIDLSRIDANVYASGNQAFTFIGQGAFSGRIGEIRYEHVGNETILQLQTGVEADIEGVIRIAGIHTPDAGWFML